MKTKIILPLLGFITMLISCNKEVVVKPNNLIEQDQMVEIMYDLTLLSAIKIQNSSLYDKVEFDTNDYIYKKYKIDSLQFAQSNIYYASNTKEYVKMIEEIKSRVVENKVKYEILKKAKAKKDVILKKKLDKLKKIKLNDSINKAKKNSKVEKDTLKNFEFIDAHWYLYIDEYLKTPSLKRF